MLTKSAKIWLFLLIISAIFWLGGINVRFIIGNELLNYDEFSFRTGIPPEEESTIFKYISHTNILIISTQITTFLFALMFALKFKINIKENGWYLMCLLLFFVFSPVEFFSSYLDLRFVLNYFNQPFSRDELLKLFGERIGFLKGVPWIAMLGYYTIIAVAIFRPLKVTKKDLEKQKKLDENTSYKYHLHEEDDVITD